MVTIPSITEKKMLNHKPTKYYCDHCGEPISESLIMVDKFYKYNSLACANCTDYDEYDEDEDHDQPYVDWQVWLWVDFLL